MKIFVFFNKANCVGADLYHYVFVRLFLVVDRHLKFVTDEIVNAFWLHRGNACHFLTIGACKAPFDWTARDKWTLNVNVKFLQKINDRKLTSTLLSLFLNLNNINEAAFLLPDFWTTSIKSLRERQIWIVQLIVLLRWDALNSHC